MLNVVVQQEEPEKEEQRIKNIKDLFENRASMERSEKQILQLINESNAEDLLNDEKLIEALQHSKKQTQSTQERIITLDTHQATLNKVRQFYEAVARLVATLFFVFMDLSNIDHMYQFSLEWYVDLFQRAIKRASNKVPERRCQSINDTFMQILYNNACRTLKEEDKILLSFLMCTRILLIDSRLTLVYNCPSYFYFIKI